MISLSKLIALLTTLFSTMVLTMTCLGSVTAHAEDTITDFELASAVISKQMSRLPKKVGKQMGGSRQGVKIKFKSPVKVSTFAGTNGFGGSTNGVGLMAKFSGPLDITTDGRNLYVIDQFQPRIRKIVIATGVVSDVAGNGYYQDVDGKGQLASFYSLDGITTDGTNLYVITQSRVRKIVIATGVVTTLAGRCFESENCYIDSAAGALTLVSEPTGITTNGTYLFVTGYNYISKILISTGAGTIFAGGAGSYLPGYIDGIGTAAAFTHTTGITTDGVNLYVNDSDRIRKIVISSGEVSTLVSAATTPYVLDKLGNASQFGRHYGITTDGTNLYATSDTNRVHKIVIATGAVTTLAGSGANAAFNMTLNVDGIGTEAEFAYPLGGITTDGTSLYLTDTALHLIRKIK